MGARKDPLASPRPRYEEGVLDPDGRLPSYEEVEPSPAQFSGECPKREALEVLTHGEERC